MRTDDVDWGLLESAYGRADGVPEMLAGLHRTDAGSRGETIADLWSALCHQETVYDASAAAVPFLLQAAREAPLTPAERHQVLALLVSIGRGEETCWEGYVPWRTVQRCAHAVEAVLPDLADWAAGGSPEARTWSVVLATYFPDSFRALGRDVTDWLTNPSPEVAQLVRVLVAGGEPEPSLVAVVASLDEETRDWLEQGLVDRSPTRQGRQVLQGLAEKDLL
jgi:hypothetical protein